MYYFGGCNVLTILYAISAAVGAESRLQSRYAVKDSHYVPKAWRRIGPAPGEHLIKLQIGLKQGQFAKLERHLYEGMHPAVRIWNRSQCIDKD